MLSGLNINNLLDIFSKPNFTLDHILSEFMKDYSYDRFKVCYGLSVLLQDNVFISLQAF